ncbi:MAG: hypothetical protein H6936_03970 [Burkholderiales bacterium]|nr:hypothetical protein [Nitrosomonas sp.]MCP5274011.1 hypothetical protein [Burkholderiales bacterium]
MRRKQDKHVFDLPKWFSLDKYDQANNLNAEGWLIQLSWRLGILHLLSHPTSIWEIDKPIQIKSKNLIHALELARNTPILNIINDHPMSFYFHSGSVDELRSKRSKELLGVHLLTVREHYRIEYGMEGNKRTYARNFFSQIYDDSNDLFKKPLKYKCKDWIDKPINELSSSNYNNIDLTVDLGIPDKVLVNQFKKLLLEMRRPLHQIDISLENKSKINFSAWIKSGVLPYLDLHIWKIETGIKFPDRIMADAIFPDGEGGEDNLRKTTKKHAKELMNDKFLNKLAAVAVGKISEQNKP